MRIACLQFAPQVGETDQNIDRADAILERADPQDIDLLVLPELAFSGYNFKSLRHISPHLELGETGISTAWSRQAALKYDCVVITGYPEKVDPAESWPADPEHYNSAVIMNGDGDVVGNYRKSHLYYTDETWALEGGCGFYTGCVQGLGHMVVGICMDINPYKFEAPWEAYEFSSHVLETGARLVVLSMAWCTHVDQEEFFLNPAEPDMETLLYWITRLQPIISIDFNQETIVVFGNRCGAEGDTTYVGTSTVLGIKSGEISLYGILGRDEESLLVVDTDTLPYAKLQLKSHEPVPAQDQGEDIEAPQVHTRGGLSDHLDNENDPGMGTTHSMGTNQASLTDIQKPTLGTVLVTRSPERDPQPWLKPSRRPREHPTSGPFRVEGNSVEISSSGSHIDHTQFTQSHIAAPVTQKHDVDELRPTMSDGDYDNNRTNAFSEADEESTFSDSFTESDEGDQPRAQEPQMYGGARQCRAASTHREQGAQDADMRYPSAQRSQARLPSAQPEQDDILKSCLVQLMSAFSLDNEVLPSSNTENFKEEDIYKFVHGKNLTSEHHVRYHTHMLREKRARQGLPPDADDDEEELETYPEQEEEVFEFQEHVDAMEPYSGPRCVADGELTSLNMISTDLGAQPSYFLGNVTEARQTFWLQHSPEPTPIADTPMCYMTQFSPAWIRLPHDRRAPAFAQAMPSRTGRHPPARHVEEPDYGIKTGNSWVGEMGMARISGLADVDGDDNAAYNSQVPALTRSKAKGTSVPLQHPSRRPKAAARQVPPLRLVPREAPREKQREREVRERSRRTTRQVPIAPETERPQLCDNGHEKGGDRSHKIVPMVLVYEGEGEGIGLSNWRC